MDKSTKTIINAGVGMINLTNKIWKKKFNQLIKEEKLEKDFGEGFLTKLESKVKKKQKKYNSFIKAIHKYISKSKKKNKSKKQKKEGSVSKKTIVEFTLETFKESNKVWVEGFKQLIKEGRLTKVDGKSFMKNIDLIGKQQCESYLKDMATIISDSLGKNKKKTSKTPNNAVNSILGMITIVKDSWKKKKKKKESTKANEKEIPNKQASKMKKCQEKFEVSLTNIKGKSELLETYEKRIQELEAKVTNLTGELDALKMHQESAAKETVIHTPIKKTIAKKVIAKKLNTTKVNLDKTNSNPEKDNLKKIEGIGPKIESLLHNAGILTFTQLSTINTEALKTILLEAGNRFKRHNPTTWAKQATLAAKGNWEALKRWQDELKGGK